MKNTIFFLLIAAGVALLLGADKPACCSSEKPQCPKQCDAIGKAILQIHDKIIAAAEKRDADEMFSYISENDEGAIIQDGQLLTRQQALETTKKGFAGMTNVHYNFRQRNVKILSPTIAILTGIGDVTVTFESGQSVTSEFANSSVFVLQDGGWKIIHGHHSIPNPKP